MVYLVLTQNFLIQLIDHFFNNFTNGKGASNKKRLTMQSSIVIKL